MTVVDKIKRIKHMALHGHDLGIDACLADIAKVCDAALVDMCQVEDTIGLTTELLLAELGERHDI